MAQTHTISSPEELRAFTQEHQNIADEVHIQLRLLKPLTDPDILRASQTQPGVTPMFWHDDEGQHPYVSLVHVGRLWRSAWLSFLDAVPLASLTFDATLPTWQDEEGNVHEFNVREGRMALHPGEFQKLVLLLATQAKMRGKGDREFLIDEQTLKNWPHRGNMRRYLKDLSSFRREKVDST